MSDSPHFLRYSAIRVLWFVINYLLSSLGWHKIWTSIQCKNVQEFVKTVSWLLLTFLMFTQPIKFYTFYCHILRVQMFKQGDSLNKQNKRLLLPTSINKFYRKIWVGFCLQKENASEAATGSVVEKGVLRNFVKFTGKHLR